MPRQRMTIPISALAIVIAFGTTALAQNPGSSPSPQSNCMEGMVMPGCSPLTMKQQPNSKQNMPGVQHEQHEMGNMQMTVPQQ